MARKLSAAEVEELELRRQMTEKACETVREEGLQKGWMLCGDCLVLHSKQISCEEVAEMMDADEELMRRAIG